MNGNDERGIVPAFNSSHSTVKIDSLCIKLGIRKEKDDASKCRHFSIRGFVAGMREKRNSNLSPYTKELPPIEVPNFRYWRCEKCSQNNIETENASNETALISGCVLSPSARPHPQQDMNLVAFVPFGEGTSGSKAVDATMVTDLEADEGQTFHEMTDGVQASQEPTILCASDTNAGTIVSNELIDHENSQDTSMVHETISQPLEPGQEIDNYQNGHPKRKARKVRLLKELLCGSTENQQQKDNSSSSPPRIKRRMLHDHDNDHDHDHDDHHHHDPKKSKPSKADAVAKNNVTEPSRNPGGSEFEENINRYEWNRSGAQRSSIHGKIGSDPMTAWRSIFNDMGRTESRLPPTYSAPKSRGTEPYPNFMNPLKSDKRSVSSSKKTPSNPIKSKFFIEDSRRMRDDSRPDTGLGLDLSLNYDPQSNIRPQPSVLNRPFNQDYSRKPGLFSGETSNFASRIQKDSMNLLERSVPYGGCSGHQKLDFSDPYKRNNIGVGGYSEFTRPGNNNHQRQENMFSIGRSDEREVIELMAKNQYERNLSEANNGIISGFHKPMNEQMASSHPEYLNMIRPGENVSPMRSPPGGFFHQDRVSNFTMNQKKPFNGVWMSDTGPQRHYDSRYQYASNGNGKKPLTHLYNPSNMQVLEGFNKYMSGTHQHEVQHEVGNMQFGQAYAKYSDKDKGKSMMNLDLNLVAEEQNNFESLDVNRNRMCSFDSSYSNEAIPAMQLLSLMDAGKLSHQPFSLTGQTNITKPNSSCFSHCGSTVTERTSPFVNPIGSSHSSAFRPTQKANLTASSHGQQVYRKQQEVRSRGASLASVGFQPEDSYVFPFPWQGGEGQTTTVNRALGPRSDSVRTDICTLNQNPADITSPGPENPFMINPEDLVRKRGSSHGQIVKRKP